MSDADGGTPSKRRGQDREVLERMWAARSRNARERRIRELIEQAPALTAEQCARLSTLLNSGTAATAFTTWAGTFTHDSMERALSSHESAGLISGWHARPLGTEDGPEPRDMPGRRWRWLVTMADGQDVPVCTGWELHALLHGLASARHAQLKAGQVRRP